MTTSIAGKWGNRKQGPLDKSAYTGILTVLGRKRLSSPPTNSLAEASRRALNLTLGRNEMKTKASSKEVKPASHTPGPQPVGQHEASGGKVGGINYNMTMTKKPDVSEIKTAIRALNALPLEEKVEAINALRLAIHNISPFRAEPVDCIQWVKTEEVEANDYNPNSVAPPEMELLKLSILADGYTQPIVTFKEASAGRLLTASTATELGGSAPKLRIELWAISPS